MLCSRFLKTAALVKHGWAFNATERLFDGWLRFYDWTLHQSLRFHGVTMAVSLGLLAGTVYLFTITPKGFLPNEDTGIFRISTEAVQGMAFSEMVRHQTEIAEISGEGPEHRLRYQRPRGRAGGGTLLGVQSREPVDRLETSRPTGAGGR